MMKSKLLELNSNNNELSPPTIDSNLYNGNCLKNESHILPMNKKVYGQGSEALTIKKELGDFNVNESLAYKMITRKFGQSIRLNELIGILNSIIIYNRIKNNIILPQISRNEKRSFPLLIKYVEQHNNFILPHLNNIHLGNSFFQKIDKEISKS